ncbi:hypothetical protein PG985_004494 [Apiospora marii]|uniref:DUF7136 domain-containing protein n=1 Tax=Apiospora marii TaxID=335849 RepID=A0ABR1SBP0_9PEZI
MPASIIDSRDCSYVEHSFCERFLFALFFALRWVESANAARTLPADVQFDFIFPRNNETYAPTQLFPLVFGVNNLDAVWPLKCPFVSSVQSITEVSDTRPSWMRQSAGYEPSLITDAVGDGPGQ